MAFIIGTYGPITASLSTKLVSLITAQTEQNELCMRTANNLLMYAGYKKTAFTDTIIPLPNGSIVGKIFDSTTHQPATISPELAYGVTTNPRLLLKKIWGQYVAALHNKHKNTLTLVRDPLGLATVFYIVQNNSILFCSDIDMLYDLLENKPSLNNDYFAEHLINKNQALPITPFQGIYELLPGMALTATADGTITQELVWDISGCKGTFIANKDAFEEELLATLRATVKAWTADSTGVCVELSGGLDSSSVMLLVRDVLQQDAKLVGVNYIDSGMKSSNEIEHAQEIADAVNAPLQFIDWQDCNLLDALPTGWRPNRPNTFLLFPRINTLLYALAQHNGCDTIMNGQGGDHVFLAPAPKEALADYWLQRGIRGITTPLKELCNTYRMPWSALAMYTAKTVLNKKNTDSVNEPSMLDIINPAYLQHLTQQDFYLTKELATFNPGKRAHIENLAHGIAFAERNQRTQHYSMTHPLFSQPLVELALTIPTYQSFGESFDRIFFRRAVTRLKKTKSVWRHIKGQTTGSMVTAFAQNSGTIREMLFEGTLVKSGIINTAWLDTQLTKIRHGQNDNLWPVIHTLTGQLWLNQWKM